MKIYEWRDSWVIVTAEVEEIISLGEQLRKRLNTGLSGTIPKLAKAMKADEQKIAWALQDLCECHKPYVLMDNKEGEAYFMKFIDLRNALPKPFNDETEFYGADMR